MTEIGVPRGRGQSVLALVAISVFAASVARGEVRLPAIFGDNMVLQRNFATPIWGTASPNQSITLTIAGQTKQATAGPDGKWSIKLDPTKEGGPYELTVSGPTSITYKNVLFGDVWICSGQSNISIRGDEFLKCFGQCPFKARSVRPSNFYSSP